MPFEAPIIKVIIPALNEEAVIGDVVNSIKDQVSLVIVVDNGSTDETARTAQQAGALVVSSPVAGYGRACLDGVAAAGPCDILVFMDGDGADDPADLPVLLAPILDGTTDMVIGSRLSGKVDDGALKLSQRFGNSLACFLMRIFWQGQFTDLGPFRAITRKAYDRLEMKAPTFGWTVEMQVRALKRGLSCAEIPVHYRNRIGVSKISGTIKGVVLAGAYILGTIGREVLFHRGEKSYSSDLTALFQNKSTSLSKPDSN